MVVGGAVSDLEAGDGVFSTLPESLVDPGHDGFICHLLSVTKLLQDVESVPEETGRHDTHVTNVHLDHQRRAVADVGIVTFS